MRVAGIDPALGGTGYAGPDGRTWLLTEKAALGPYERMSRIATRIDRLVADHDVELVVLEDYGGGGPGRTSMIRGIELGGILRVSFLSRLLPWVAIAPSTLKAYATGDGRADKAALADAYEARFRFAAGISHDEIDAVFLADVGRWLVRDPAALGPHEKTKRESVLGIIERAEKALGASSVRTRETP